MFETPTLKLNSTRWVPSDCRPSRRWHPCVNHTKYDYYYHYCYYYCYYYYYYYYLYTTIRLLDYSTTRLLNN